MQPILRWLFLHFTGLWMVVFPLSPSCCSSPPPHTGLVPSFRATQHPQIRRVRSDLLLQPVAFACASSEGTLSLSSCSSLSVASRENVKTFWVILCWEMSHLTFPSWNGISCPLTHGAIHHSLPQQSELLLSTTNWLGTQEENRVKIVSVQSRSYMITF